MIDQYSLLHVHVVCGILQFITIKIAMNLNETFLIGHFINFDLNIISILFILLIDHYMINIIHVHQY